MMQELIVGRRDKLWVGAKHHACNTGNMCVTTSHDGGISPFDKWFNRKPLTSSICNPSGLWGYMCLLTTAHKLSPRGGQRIMMGIACDHPSGTVRVSDVQTGQIVHCQDVSWHPGHAPMAASRPMANGGARLATSGGGEITALNETRLTPKLKYVNNRGPADGGAAGARAATATAGEAGGVGAAPRSSFKAGRTCRAGEIVKIAAAGSIHGSIQTLVIISPIITCRPSSRHAQEAAAAAEEGPQCGRNR